MRRPNLRLRLSSSYSPRIRVRGYNRFLDSSISIRTVLKYTAIVLLFIVVLGFVFMLGKHFSEKNTDVPNTVTEKTGEIKGDTTQTQQTEDTQETEETETIAETEPATTEDTQETPDIQDVPEPTIEKPAVETKPVTTTTTPTEIVPCVAKSAGFDYPYSKVNVTVWAINSEKKSDNWATINSVDISVTNGEDCIITNPTQIKIKVNNKGKGSSWWDDEVFLPDTFKKVMPGETVSETVSVHVAYSDISTEKDFKLVVFDDYGIDMATYRKYVFLK